MRSATFGWALRDCFFSDGLLRFRVVLDGLLVLGVLMFVNFGILLCFVLNL